MAVPTGIPFSVIFLAYPSHVFSLSRSKHLKTHVSWILSPFLKSRLKEWETGREVIVWPCVEWCLKQIYWANLPWLVAGSKSVESMRSAWRAITLGQSSGEPLKKEHKYEYSIKGTPWTTIKGKNCVCVWGLRKPREKENIHIWN